MSLSAASSGLGVRPELFREFSKHRPSLAFIEAHSENYFGASPLRDALLALREDYPVSLHGVGLSLGRADALDREHIGQLKELVEAVDPVFVSEHLSWSAFAHRQVPDLLPLPLNNECFLVLCSHIDQLQTALGRQVLIENPSNYLTFDEAGMEESDFLNELAKATGCGLLLDVNNVYVSARNLALDPLTYIKALNSAHVYEYHLAGHTEVSHRLDQGDETVLIDTHDHPVSESVWALFESTVECHGARPTLIEWDSAFPKFDVLQQQCDRANRVLVLVGGASDDMGSSREVQDAVRSGLLPAKENFDPERLARQQTTFLSELLQRQENASAVTASYQARFKVYQNNVFGALQNYLANVFPALKGVVGEAFFKQTMQSLIQSYPPQSGNLHDYGAELISFLPSVTGVQHLPYLFDLVRYEWGLHYAYYCRQANALRYNEVAQDNLLTLTIKVRDSLSMITSDYPILAIHRQSLPDHRGAVSVDLSQGADNLLVFRLAGQVETKCIELHEAALIRELQVQGTLFNAIESLSDQYSSALLSAGLAKLFEWRVLSEVGTV